MNTEDLIHGLCRIAAADGAAVPSLAEPPGDAEVPAVAAGSVLHVFAAPAEAAAFAAGAALDPAGPVCAAQGVDGAERVVLVSVRTDAEVAGRDGIGLVDHGGAALQRAQALWRGLASSVPEPFAFAIAPDGSAELVLGPRRFALEVSYGEIVATTGYAANDKRVSTAIACDWTTSVLDYLAKDGALRINFDPERFLSLLPRLVRLDELVAGEESRDAASVLYEQVRRDPEHCKVVELMLSGWRLTSTHHTAALVPPQGSDARMRRIGGGMLSRLVEADLVRKPRHATGRSGMFAFAFEVGSLDGTAVRRPDPQVGR
ncbi:hypothetical protein [Methylorubrum extorquens]|nr:hypothetical protein [Methylorubrum extorquens]MCP1545626.1 hypothetical protein [Methylorubrum extorquens]MCP1591577.1 hypothetical protein [Methylorubrum extorquens]